jgi:hypothetical protein
MADRPATSSNWLIPGRNPGQAAAFPYAARGSPHSAIPSPKPRPRHRRSPRLPPHNHRTPARQRRRYLEPLPARPSNLSPRHTGIRTTHIRRPSSPQG